MLTFIGYSLVFACGMLAAIVDWESFLSEMLSFKKVQNQVRMYKFNSFQMMIIGVFLFCIFAYFVIIFIPARFLYHYFESKHLPLSN